MYEVLIKPCPLEYAMMCQMCILPTAAFHQQPPKLSIMAACRSSESLLQSRESKTVGMTQNQSHACHVLLYRQAYCTMLKCTASHTQHCKCLGLHRAALQHTANALD